MWALGPRHWIVYTNLPFAQRAAVKALVSQYLHLEGTCGAMWSRSKLDVVAAAAIVRDLSLRECGGNDEDQQPEDHQHLPEMLQNK